MPRSNGIFTLVASYFATAGQTIRTEQHNPPLEDIAQALTDSLPRNGTAGMTGNLPMGGRRITGLGAATAASDAVRLDQLPAVTVQSGPYDTTAGRLLTPGAFGLGLLGSAVVATDIDATMASGTQQFTTGAVGTFPVGVTAANGGKVNLVRASVTDAYEVLQPNNANSMFWRRLATTWQAWQQVVSVLDSTVANGDMLARVGGAWVRVPQGTEGQMLQAPVAGAAPIWADAITARPVQSTAAGTAFNFTDIPAWAKRITVLLNNVSLSAGDSALVQLGTGAGFTIVGYSGTLSTVDGGGTATNGFTTGFGVGWTDPSEANTSKCVLDRVHNTNTWMHSVVGVRSGSGANIFGAGVITLAAALTQLRLTRTGAATFDAGSVSITYE